ncbi:PaaI family thioesterase [Desulfosarcina ovata]|uniref:Thioesterase n=1 Tax=Desulfosarcina ovata subsp. ovata TaxID=2752305 RepID=A0A5K8AJB3_9BACT|nr:PaaI family thioesterase [Desulfosarcina ovata]BBO92793.1 thioesterase [Desulfosarcina ovata subsp. ovata]
MTLKAFQDYYPDNYAHCYGCGRLNDHGLKIKSYWDGEESVCHFSPRSYHTGGFSDILYGGLIASLIDCHAAGTASAAQAREKGIDPETQPLERFVTASIKVDYLAPTPVDTVELRAKVREISGRKVWVDVTVSADGKIRAKGETLMIQVPDPEKK